MEKAVICIGAPRSGTTWLFNNLCCHPDLFLPPVKEVRHFFGSHSAAEREAQGNKSLRESRDDMERAWTRRWMAADPLSTVDYRSLILENGLPTVDISPIYCAAPPERIVCFREAVGEAKILMFLRNPVDRDYSQAKRFFHMEGGGRPRQPLETYKDFLSRPDIRRRNDYLSAIKNWTGVFGADALHIEFYDSIQSDPLGVLSRICRAIGVIDTPEIFGETAMQRYGDGIRHNGVVPEELKLWLADRHRDGIRALAESFPVPCVKWSEQVAALIAE